MKPDDQEIEPVTIIRKALRPWWDVDITPFRLFLAMGIAVMGGMTLAILFPL